MKARVMVDRVLWVGRGRVYLIMGERGWRERDEEEAGRSAGLERGRACREGEGGLYAPYPTVTVSTVNSFFTVSLPWGQSSCLTCLLTLLS